jgi:polysaccharide export outer membrane protein
VSAGFAQVATRVPPADAVRTAAAPPKPVELPSYTIQPDDILEIFVRQEPTISRERVLVRPDGRISLPQVQDLQAAGLTPVQLKESLEEKLTEWIKVPNVTVIVESIQSYKIYVMGNVAGPGVQISATPLTIMHALAAAGGFTTFADKSDITIFRGDERIRFNYEEFTKGKKVGQNIVLRSGDVVNVP